jgi:hypothetical protein
MLFDRYLFADYSGARSVSSQRKTIKIAEATPSARADIIDGRYTRESLRHEIVRRLQQADQAGERVCFGQDHQYGLPVGFLRELGLENLRWRDALNSFFAGSYHSEAPAICGPGEFAAKLNEWLVSRTLSPYFYSATKSTRYGIPGSNPRSDGASLHRLTELCMPASGRGAPKTFNRVGDPGTVGGQTLHGLESILRLLTQCEEAGVRVAVWPFDGLSLSDPCYEGRHVMVEPYPSAVRGAEIAQSDSADAIASTEVLRRADLEGTMNDLLDLSQLSAEEARIARIEGWIVAHRPELRRRSY